MEVAEWYETVFVIGKKTTTGTFDNVNCKVFDKNGCRWVVGEQFYEMSKLSEDPCKWNEVHSLILYIVMIRERTLMS